MRNLVGRGGAVILAMVLTASVAEAQIANQPVYVSPKHGKGLSFAFDYGKGLNDSSGKLSAYGGRATLGLGFITVMAGASSVSSGSGAGSELSYGGTASINIISAPLVPVGVSVFGGYGTVKINNVRQNSYPIGAAFAVRPPTAGIGIEIWAAPRVDIKNAASTTATNFGISGGVNLDLPIGLGIHAAVDYVAVSNAAPLLLGVGAHYKFTIPGLGI